MEPNQLFRYCPRCAAACIPGKNPLTCPACSFCYFFNPTCAAGAYVFDPQGRAIFIERAKEPAKGKFALPGGFIDIGETAEDALRREVREEVGLEIEGIAFLASYPNSYHYRDVHYPVCDFIFTAKAVRAESAQALDGVSAFRWLRIEEIDPTTLAFPSIRKSWELLRDRSG
jgi:ADP-ribose pyrophosphatase YjhB (NUDIX family)